jgi:hypothetical protein
MAAAVAVETEGGLMEPLTTIELRTAKWLGIIALACSAAAELMRLANEDHRAISRTTRANTSRAITRRTNAR